MSNKSSIHKFKIDGLTDGTVDFAEFKGKYILLVNTASACGYTPQYGQLQELYDNFKDKLVVVGVPCNDFGGQEPADADTIAQFCSKNFGVTFPLTTKISTNNPQHHLFSWLTKQNENGVLDTEIKWNFHKFLLDVDGILIADYPSSVNPADEQILDVITG